MRHLTTGCRLGVVLLTLALACFADSVSFDAGTTYVIDPALTGFSTFGDMMVGMQVTAWFGAASTTATWAATGPGAGAATAANFSVGESGDTFGGTWTLTNNSSSGLTRLVIDGPPGKTVFDINWSGEGTPGSANGWTFQKTGSAGVTVDATYRNLAAITGNAPVGDLYTQLDLAISGLGPGGTLTWISDTDSVPLGGTVNPVPEPATLGFLSFTVVALGLLSAANALDAPPPHGAVTP